MTPTATERKPFIEIYIPVHTISSDAQGPECVTFACGLCHRHSMRTLVVADESSSAGTCERGHGFEIRTTDGYEYAVFRVTSAAV